MHYRRMRRDPEYALAFHQAREQAIGVLEDEAVRRAVEGTKKPIYYKGYRCGYELVYSDTLMQFLLSAANPVKYRQNHKVEHTGPNDGPIIIDLTKLSDEQLAALEQLVDAAKRNDGGSGN